MSDDNQKRGLAAKLLLPVVATVASGVASYLAKKGPQLLEETVLPKLREAKKAAPDPGDVAHDLADRARSAAHGGGDEDDVSNDELERRRRERAEHRAARRQAS